MADYSNIRLNPSCPGVLSDTSEYNIDGACVAQGNIPFGAAVQVVEIVEGVKVVKALAAGGIPYGIAMRSQYEHLAGEIKDGESVNIVSHGRIWTLTSLDQAPALFAKLQFGDGGLVTGFAGTEGWTFAGGFVRNGSGYLIEVQVLQNGFIVPPPAILVESASITTDKASPQPNNVTVQCVVKVLLANADDKTGSWSIDAANIATIDQSGKLTPVGGDVFGNVNITWTANDASKTNATIAYRFDKAVIKVTGASVSLAKESANIGDTVQASVVVTPENATNKSGSWSVSNGDLATVDPATGLVTTKATGEVDVIWTAADGSGVKGQAKLTITEAPAP